MSNNYWVVGASWGGYDHKDREFVDGGYWMLGWEKKEQPKQYDLAKQMKPGDRIAIKRMKGQGQTEINILHIGIIQDVIETNKVICEVNWVATDLEREVASRGCFKSIHVFRKDRTKKEKIWVEKVFCLPETNRDL